MLLIYYEYTTANNFIINFCKYVNNEIMWINHKMYIMITHIIIFYFNYYYMNKSTPNLPVTIPPPSSTRVTNCISKCKISTAYTSLFTNGLINNTSTFNVNNTSINFNYMILYSSAKDTNSNINTINVNQLSTYYLSEIRVYSPPINTYTNQKTMIDSEIVLIHSLRVTSYINNSATSEIPNTVVFFIPANINTSDGDKRAYTISSLIGKSNSYEPFRLKVQDLLPKKSKFYSYVSNIPITSSSSLKQAEFIHCLSLIFDITPIAVLGINRSIVSKFNNTINTNSIKMCPSGSLCGVANISYAPMGLNPNTNSYYLSCGDVSPQNITTPSPSSTSDLFKKYNITIDTIYTIFNILVGGFIAIILLWVVGGIIIGFVKSSFA